MAGDRLGSYLHIYMRSKVMRVTEIPQRDKCFQDRNHEKPRRVYCSTLRVENAVRKTCQLCEIVQWSQ